jgi:sugar O-acyltransferase (sialic acid O-acetyltransferase NeuD family)
MTRWQATSGKRLLIVGAGGFGREVLAYAVDVVGQIGSAAAPTINFVDDNPVALAGRLLPVSAAVVTSTDGVSPTDDELYLIAVGDPNRRYQLARKLAARGARFCTLVHPTAYVAATATVAPGCVVAPFAFVGPGASLGEHTVLNTYASVGHDSVVGGCAVLSPYAVVNGAVDLGAGSFLGTHAAVTPGRKIGAWSKLAAGAIATMDLPAGSLAVGNPAHARVMFTPPSD